MKVPFTLLFILCLSAVHGQDMCPAVIDWKYNGAVDIYDAPGGSIIAQMKNDSINEDYLHLQIVGQTETYFMVSISSMHEAREGWIRKADYIGTYVRNENQPMNLELFRSRKASESEKIMVSNWSPALLTIEKCADKWAFVSTKHKGKSYKGWVEIDKLCANSYTTCN